MKIIKTLIALITAALTLAGLIASASARNFRSSTTTFRTTWTAAEFSGGFGTVRCALTLEGELGGSTVTKTRGAEMGFVSRVTIGTCAVGSATILRESLPWRVRYGSFTGVLPRISSITTDTMGVAFQLREPVFGITCLAASTEARPFTGTYNLGAGGEITSVTLGGEVPTNCGLNGSLRGTSSTNSAQTITLI